MEAVFGMAHTHCDGCFSSNCNSNEGCSIVYCPDCDSDAHSCKINDHIDHICPESIVTCVNHQYGCQAEIKRKELPQHMSKCSVMLDEITSSKTVECDSCSAVVQESDLPDHNKVCMEHRTSCINKPFGCQLKMKRKEMNHHLQHCTASIVNCSYTYSRIGHTYVHVGVRNLCSPNYSAEQPDEKFLIADIKKENHLEPLSLETFRWGKRPTCKFVRRDEFSSHWKSHIHFVDDLQECIKRCPLFSYGCMYSTTRFQPGPEPGSTFEYKSDISSFVIVPPVVTLTTDGGQEQTTVTGGSYADELIKKQELLAYGYGDDIIGSIDVIGQLPVEVLMLIMSFCDSLSLWCLSQVNFYLRDICHEVAAKQGMVFGKWEKIGKKWQLVSMVCSLYSYI